MPCAGIVHYPQQLLNSIIVIRRAAVFLNTTIQLLFNIMTILMFLIDEASTLRKLKTKRLRTVFYGDQEYCP